MTTCERCQQPIQGRAVEPGNGFSSFHLLCWNEEWRDIQRDHIQINVDEDMLEEE